MIERSVNYGLRRKDLHTVLAKHTRCLAPIDEGMAFATINIPFPVRFS